MVRKMCFVDRSVAGRSRAFPYSIGMRSCIVKSLLKRVWREDEGVLTFEWILLITVLAIGIVGGLSAVRDAIISELGDVAAAVTALDQSYTIINPMEVVVHTGDVDGMLDIDGGSDSYFLDSLELYDDCRPATPPLSQGPRIMTDDGDVVE
jgi:Flp pilus assembly pilin Flp